MQDAFVGLHRHAERVHNPLGYLQRSVINLSVVVIVLIAVSLMHISLHRALVVGVILSACATVMVTNCLDPEAMVARENIERVEWSSGNTRRSTMAGPGTEHEHGPTTCSMTCVDVDRCEPLRGWRRWRRPSDR
ncbi:MAG: hypothetical protein JWN99_1306, partial [Ilumatobacteraceae bacterium]|nr:hypothetical protein [Ilumatobacteraceae bacterium]